MKEKIKWLEDIITTNISELMARMEANEENDKTQDKIIEHNEDMASTESSSLRVAIINNNDTINSRVDQVNQEFTKDLSEVSQDLLVVQDDLIPGIGSIIPWIPSK